MTDFPYLSTLINIPICGAIILCLFFNDKNESQIQKTRYFTIFITALNFIASIYTAVIFQSTESLPLNHIYFSYKFIEFFGNKTPILGVDGISMLMILLTNLLMPICILASGSIKNRVKLYFINFLVLQAILIGVFSSMNALLFYMWFEFSLVPMFIIIGIWGGETRIYAAFKFFLYTFLGSILFLVAILYLERHFNSFDIVILQQHGKTLDFEIQKYLFLAFFAAFAVKIPMFPFHTWLPDAHVQAPTAGSVILAGILLKLGAYGFLRFSIPMLPAASVYYTDFISILSIISIVYASLIAFRQNNMKKMIAYSSIAHMGYVTIGMFIGLRYNVNSEFTMDYLGYDVPYFQYSTALYGSIFQMISHGIVSAALFLIVGSLSDRTNTKEIADYGGVAKTMPNLAFFFMIFMLASIGLPSTSGFIGEFMVIIGTISYHKSFGIIAALGVVLGAIYMLNLYAKTMFGQMKHSRISSLKDLSCNEIIIYSPLAILTMIFGIYPNLISNYFMEPLINLAKYFN